MQCAPYYLFVTLPKVVAKCSPQEEICVAFKTNMLIEKIEQAQAEVPDAFVLFLQ